MERAGAFVAVANVTGCAGAILGVDSPATATIVTGKSTGGAGLFVAAMS